MGKEILFYRNVMNNWLTDKTTHKLRKQIKFITRTLLYYNKSKELANFVMNHKYLSEVVLTHDAFVCGVLHKPYMTYTLSSRDKIDIIKSSYKFLDKYFKPTTLDELYEKGKIKILDISGKSGIKLTLYFRIYTNFDKEGEFSIHLYQGEYLLATLTFSIWNDTLFIGGLQGLGRNNNDPKLLKDITKEFYGVFPKKLVMEVVYNLFPMKKIAVSNEMHIYNAWRYRYQKKRTVQASYDDFWESLGGVKRKDKIWELPKIIERKSIEDIPSKKRSQYRKRYEILDSLEEKVKEFKDKNTIKEYENL